MVHYYFLFGDRADIQGLCSVLAINKEAAKYKADNDMRNAFGLDTDPRPQLTEVSNDDFIELAIEYRNRVNGMRRANIIIS